MCLRENSHVINPKEILESVISNYVAGTDYTAKEVMQIMGFRIK